MTVRVPIQLLIIALLFCATHHARAASATIAPDTFRLYAPADSLADTVQSTDHRWRLQVGGCAAIAEKRYGTIYIPSLNIDRRWTWLFAHGDNGYAVGPLAEVGMNLIVPYAKAGFEMRAGGFFFDVHGGVAAGLVPDVGAIAIPVFYGGCAGVMMGFGDVRVELETGINYTTLDVPFMFPYATIALTL